ncbi:MAG: aminotransferase class V-fold PLP-dependent enzyme, partial [Gemmatimonadales bacterium]
MRAHNFNAGPGVLPESVVKQLQQDLWDVGGSGIGILEHSHRGKVFDRIITEAEAAARRLAGIPDNYRVLFIQGGASQQFAMVPMNLLPPGGTADFLVTGSWSEKALKEAKRFGAAHTVATGKASNYAELPDPAGFQHSAGPAYLHVT